MCVSICCLKLIYCCRHKYLALTEQSECNVANLTKPPYHAHATDGNSGTDRELWSLSKEESPFLRHTTLAV